jgi:hypothetical protein
MHQKFSTNSKNLKLVTESAKVTKSESTNFETKSKRPKADFEQDEESVASETALTNTKELINEEMFDLMDKEVNEELDESSSEEEEGEETNEENQNASESFGSSDSDSSGSFRSEDSIDDQFALDFERELLNKNS